MHRCSSLITISVAAVSWCLLGGSAAAQGAQRAGVPDLSGVWGGAGGGQSLVDQPGDVTYTANARDGSAVNFERDATLQRRLNPNKPIYKADFWAKVQSLDVNRNKEDSFFSCRPAGVPRMGPPTRIVQTAMDVIFLYQGPYPTASTFRVIPTDGRPHHPINSLDQTYLGDSVGRWEGDTLVIDTVGFNDISWLDHPGYFHTTDMRVTERLRRQGDTLHYAVTVEDPAVLMEPFVMTPRQLRLNTAPDFIFIEESPCIEHDLPHLITNERH